MKILITGSTGFVGKHLTNHLATKFPDCEILALCNHIPRENEIFPDNVNLRYTDILNPDSVNLIKLFKPDITYHLAAISKPDSSDSRNVWNVNTLSTLNLLEAVSGTFVLASTLNIIGNTSSQYDNPKDNITTVYAASKRASEALVQTYCNQGRLSLGYCPRFGGIVGPGMTHGLLPDLIKKVKDDSPVVKIWNNNIKNYIHIDNVLTLLEPADKKYNGFYMHDNIVTGGALSTSDVAKIIMDEFKIYKDIEVQGKSYPGDIYCCQPKQTLEYVTSEDCVRKAVRNYK